MSAQRLALLNRGLVVGSALGALVLLVLFYGVVSGAVERATSRQAELSRGVAPAVAAPADRGRASAQPTGQLLAGATR
jgi:hypothetical protein